MKNLNVNTIEDCLEVITGLQTYDPKFKIDSSDATIMNSIARQVFKGIALTDRQYNLMKEKLQKYKEQFEHNGFDNFEQSLDNLRLELRHIDRSKTIEVVDADDSISKNIDKKIKLLRVRFPFNKSLISKLENCCRKISNKKYIHQKGSHEHYFVFDEYSVKIVLDEFASSSAFEIQSEILEFYKKIKEVEHSPETNLPCIINQTLYVNDKVKNKILSEVSDDYLKIIDRRRRYGILNFDKELESDQLVEQIAYRESTEFLCNSDSINISQIVDALHQLDRFPLLVVIQEGKEEEELYAIYNLLKGIVPCEKQSVLFRLDGDSDFNSFIKDNNLNNWVDNTTQVVYIRTDKLPKLLLNTDWKPITALVSDISSRLYRRHLHYYVSETCDLVLLRSDNNYQQKIYAKKYEIL